MAAKDKRRYQCQACGADLPKWSGQCPECGQWNTLVEVTVPEKHTGDVIGDLNARRGKILQTESRGALQILSAIVPLSKMFGYATTLRSLTQGRGNYVMPKAVKTQCSIYGNNQEPNNIESTIYKNPTRDSYNRQYYP